MDIKKIAKKTWWFIWESDSILSWVVNFIIAFILIKFIVYPGLGFLLQTSFPVVAVVSGSMEHDGSFDDWWSSNALCQSGPCLQWQWYEQRGIDREEFRSFSFKNGFNKGDIMVLYGTEPKSIKTGDVIVFAKQGSPDPIIHRVVEISQDDSQSIVFQTKGDHNADWGSIDHDIHEDALIGKAVMRIPLLGWIKIVFVELVSLAR